MSPKQKSQVIPGSFFISSAAFGTCSIPNPACRSNVATELAAAAVRPAWKSRPAAACFPSRPDAFAWQPVR